MLSWRYRPKDIALRLCGAALCGLSYLSTHVLVGLGLAEPGMLAFALAGTAFLSASLGATLLALGDHIFDEVEIAERWRTRLPAEETIPPPNTTPFEPAKVQSSQSEWAFDAFHPAMAGWVHGRGSGRPPGDHPWHPAG
jgi:hypothetical protein